MQLLSSDISDVGLDVEEDEELPLRTDVDEDLLEEEDAELEDWMKATPGLEVSSPTTSFVLCPLTASAVSNIVVHIGNMTSIKCSDS